MSFICNPSNLKGLGRGLFIRWLQLVGCLKYSRLNTKSLKPLGNLEDIKKKKIKIVKNSVKSEDQISHHNM